MNYEPTYEVLVFRCEIQDQIPPLEGPNMQNRWSIPLKGAENIWHLAYIKCAKKKKVMKCHVWFSLEPQALPVGRKGLSSS